MMLLGNLGNSSGSEFCIHPKMIKLGRKDDTGLAKGLR